MRKRAAGMARFFSKSNRNRYRRLASGTISQAEQHQLLEDLAEEMDALKREARCYLSPAAENSIDSLVTGYDRWHFCSTIWSTAEVTATLDHPHRGLTTELTKLIAFRSNS
jgi:hypothetical protein